MFQIDMNEWDKQLERKDYKSDKYFNDRNPNYIQNIIHVSVPETILSENDLYQIYIMNRFGTYYNEIPEWQKEKFKEYNFDYRSDYEQAYNDNYIFEKGSDNVKRKFFPWLFK